MWVGGLPLLCSPCVAAAWRVAPLHAMQVKGILSFCVTVLWYTEARRVDDAGDAVEDANLENGHGSAIYGQDSK